MNHNNDNKKKLFRKILISFVLLTTVVAFNVFDIGQYLALAYIRASLAGGALLGLV